MSEVAVFSSFGRQASMHMFRFASFTLRHISGMAAGFWWHMCSSDDDDDGNFGILAFGDAILGLLLLHLGGSIDSDRFKNGNNTVTR